MIDSSAHRHYLGRSPYNVVRLLLPQPDDAAYHEAAETLESWRATGVLSQDEEARFYLYRMGYRDPAGRPRQAQGIVGALGLEPLGNRVVPHEETMEDVKADRMAVLRATQANLDPIVALTPAEGLTTLMEPEGPPRLAFRCDEVHHRLYDLGRQGVMRTIEEVLAAHPVAIADGHHRYATALRYRRERRAEGAGPWDAILAFVAPARGGGLSVGPFHRLLPAAQPKRQGLEQAFHVEPGAPRPPERPGELVLLWREAHGIEALHLRPRAQAVAAFPPPWRRASSAIARELLYPLLGLQESAAQYQPEAPQIVARLDERHLGVLTAPIPAEAIVEAIDSGVRFPQKSTFFYPKPRAGVVMRVLE